MSEPRAGSRIEIVLVAAAADNGVIGRGGALPWRLKSDMQRLRAITCGQNLVAMRSEAPHGQVDIGSNIVRHQQPRWSPHSLCSLRSSV